MEQWITQFASTAPYMPYVVLVAVLLLTGFGLPLPEDLPIIVGGYLAATMEEVNPWIMFAALFSAVMVADSIVFWLGRRYGHHVRRLPVIRRYLTDRNMARAENLLNKHGGKFVFMARFLPGLRTPAILTAGTFKVPYWKLLVYDGTAALVSVPVIFFLAYYFADQIDEVRKWLQDAQMTAFGIIALVVIVFIGLKLWLGRRRRIKEEQSNANVGS